MARQTLEYVAYWSGDTVADLFEAAAALMGTGDFQGLLRTAALLGFLLMMAGAAIRYRLKDLSVWAGVVLFLAFAFLIPRVPVTVTDPAAGTVRVVDRVPLGLAFPVCAANGLSVWGAEAFETALGMLDAERFTKFGAAFPQRAVEAIYTAGPVDSAVREKLRSFVESCVATEILTDPAKLTSLKNAPSLPDLLLSGSWVNPARRVFLDGTLYSCKAATTVIKDAIESDLEKVEEKLLVDLSGRSDAMLLEAVRRAAGESETIFLGTARSLRDSLRHAVLLHELPAGLGDFAKRSAAPVAAAAELAKVQGNLATEINYRASAELAAAALPKLRALLEVLVIGVFPVMIVIALSLGIGATAMLRFYAVLLIWLALWAPIASVVNFLSLSDADPVSTLVKLYGGVTLEAADVIRKAGTTSEAMAGTLMMLVPVISFAIAKVSDNGAAAWASSVLTPAQNAANAQGASLSAGNLSVGNTSFDNVSMNNLGANRSDMSTELRSGDLLSIGTPYGSATIDASTSTVTSARRLTTDLGATVTSVETFSSGGAETSSASLSQGNSSVSGQQLQTTRGVTATTGYSSSESTTVGETLTNGVTSNKGTSGDFTRSTSISEGTTFGMETTNSEGVNLRQGVGIRLARGVNDSTDDPSAAIGNFPVDLNSISQYEIGKNRVLQSSIPNVQDLASSSVFAPIRGRHLLPERRSAFIFSGEISPNFSLQTGNSISDSASIRHGSNQSETGTIRETISHQEIKNKNSSEAITNTAMNTENVIKLNGVSRSENIAKTQSNTSSQIIGTNKSHANTTTKNIGYDESASILRETIEQFGNVQSALRSATTHGGKSLSAKLEQRIRDEHNKKSILQSVQYPNSITDNDLTEKMQQVESRILLNHAPVSTYRSNIPKSKREQQDIFTDISSLEQKHNKMRDSVNNYRENGSGVSTVIDNAFFGGMKYHDPFEQLPKK